MGVHHPMSPSHYNPWSHCVHWESDERQTAEASAGTNHHKEMEKGLNDPNYEPNTSVARWAVDWIRSQTNGLVVKSEYKLTASESGIFGTTDAFWMDTDGAYHFADLKSFSDGSENYTIQLMGYAVLYALDERHKMPMSESKVFLHVLHGGSFRVQTIETTMTECAWNVNTILEKVKAKADAPCINNYCQYCKHKGECEAMNTAITTVADSSVSFSELPLAKKLVVCDAIEKIVKSIKDEAKAKAIENGGFIEDDGVRYEIKERAGKGKVTNLSELAYAVNAVKTSMGYEGITTDQLLALCELPKTAFVNAMKEANAERKDVKKKDIEAWCAGFYTKGEPSQYLSRVS